MNLYRAIPGLLLLAVAACSSGGGGGTEPVNTAPTVAFTFPKLVVGRGATVDLTASATDKDGDKLTISWTITRGTPLTGTGKTLRWTAPLTVGTDTVRIHVTDGTHNRTITEIVKVGRVVTGTTGNLVRALGPYLIEAPVADPVVTIPANEERTIEAGTEVYLDTKATVIRVLGRLEAHGTEDLPIVFRPNDRTITCADDRRWWEGFRGESDDISLTDGEIDLEHVHVHYAAKGVRLSGGSSATIRNAKFQCCGDAGVAIEGTGTLVLLDTEIINGLGAGVLVGGSAIASLPDSVHVQGCRLAINGDAGLRLDLNDLGQQVPIVIEYNKIEFNFVHGISLGRAVFPGIHYNHFLGNGDAEVSNVFLQSGYPNGAPVATLDVTCNFWGGSISNQATIDDMIRDSLDTATVGTRVISCPWLNASPLTTTPDCSMVCP